MAATIKEQIESFKNAVGESAFFLDFDGTLVNLAPHPDKIDVPSDLIDDLALLSRDNKCVMAIVSGRGMSQLDAFLPNVGLPTIGSHGAEIRLRRDSSGYVMSQPLSDHMREALRDVSDSNSCFFEDKVYCVSLHQPFMHMDDDLKPEIMAVIDECGGDFVIRKVGRTYEIMRRGISKGSGIEHIMKIPGFLGRNPVYIGDDVCVDDSLSVIAEMGGELVSVSSAMSAQYPQHDGKNFKTEDVQDLVAGLARRKDRMEV